MDIEVGKKIAKYRKISGLSMRELSRKLKITPSMLSQIERGMANPSLNTLKSISKALDEPIYKFFLPSAPDEIIILRKSERKRIKFPESELEYQELIPKPHGAVEMVFLRIPAHHDSPNEMSSHIKEEIAYVIEGLLYLHFENDTFLLNSGDSVIIPPNMKHRISNSADQDASVIFVMSPLSY